MSKRIVAFAVVTLAIIGALSVYLSPTKVQNETVARPTTLPLKADLATPNATADISREVTAAAAADLRGSTISSGPASEVSARPQVDLTQSVVNRYAKAIKGLKLSADDERKILTLLIERAEVAYHARSVFKQEEMDNAAIFQKTIAAAQAEVEREISAEFPGELSGKILNMINARAHLQTINERVEPAMASAGVPMAPEQILPLLDIFYETYDRDVISSMRYVREKVDPATGLTDLDERALVRARAILSPEQLRELRTAIVERNNVIIKKQAST